MGGVRRASEDVTTCEARVETIPEGVTLLVRCESGALAQTLEESQTYTLGRGADCGVVIQDDSVSRAHARLSFEPRDGWRVEDLGSRNGTVVDGRRLRPGEVARLGVGSVVRLGSASAVLQSAGPARFALPPSASPGRNLSPREMLAECVVRDPAMLRLYETLEVIAASPLPVLISGETGVGKEIFACAVHARSPRAGRAMVQINCAAIPAAMLESELFGYERGAFTGATQAKPGLFETADAGTLLLDEVGELPVALQAKLLRVLETGQCQRLGAVRPRAIDVRIVSSTNRDLRAAVQAGDFRADLYHRLNGVPIRIPPLRQRRADIAPLAAYFASRMARTMGRGEATLTDDARQALEAHDWPGNVRELKNAVERAVVLAGGAPIDAAALQLEADAAGVTAERRDTAPPRARMPSQDDVPPAADATGRVVLRGPSPAGGAVWRGASPADELADPPGLREELDAMERRRVVEALERCGNNQSRAAKLLGISRHALIARIERFQLQRPRKGAGE